MRCRRNEVVLGVTESYERGGERAGRRVLEYVGYLLKTLLYHILHCCVYGHLNSADASSPCKSPDHRTVYLLSV